MSESDLIAFETTFSFDEDEFIMYELICDPQLWQFVSISSSQQLEDSNNNIDDSISDLNGGPVSISSHQSLQSTSEYSPTTGKSYTNDEINDDCDDLECCGGGDYIIDLTPPPPTSSS